MSKPVLICCGHCRGTGRLPLGDEHAATLDLLRKQRTEMNAADLSRLAGCKGAAMANRLVQLEKHGLAKGRRNGRERLWSAVR